MKLPLDCSVEYIADFLTKNEAEALYNILINEYEIHKNQLVVTVENKRIITDSFKILFTTERLIKLNSHPENIHGKSFAWSGAMANLKTLVEKYTGKTFELAMCLYYPNGNYFAPYHFDQETSGYKTILPSISLGEVRQFSFKKNDSQESFSLDLAHGSLLVMKDYSQERYTHSLLKNPAHKNGRINITFREPDFK
ncbi:hypothetical protein A8C32_12540 [Flavivirga aquatica]|uniref:Fe2OG dioxygenase domain-containing protein n=1 Tax=Flavivirga aquatica TaxID=1849968 RepID=A0A1E5TDU3_9FLAO|nr:alpha-ketoglutarate-dependent dioxygenase AlkB [Flavivirga aquatica]OEK09530.1 hypothetical protein A8C32_12540 [Flavivirga aquatica]